MGIQLTVRFAVSGATVALAVAAAGCGASTTPTSQLLGTNLSRAERVPSALAVSDASCEGQRKFKFTGHARNFKVPACATSLSVNAIGGAGEGANPSGGDGGEVSATIPVTPGETLIVMVGGAGAVARGGFNGGAVGAANRKNKGVGGGGGGASDVREGGDALTNRVVVAGGGGGTVIGRVHIYHCHHCQAKVAASSGGGIGGGLPDGGGGGTPGCDISSPTGGGGGTQSSGGAGGSGTNGGSLGNGGAGAGACIYQMLAQVIQYYTVYYSSGGGGGYYGGGGGGSGGDGGGGSGYAEPAATNVSSQNGVNSGNGSIVICWGASNGACGTRARIRR
jgi:hypothetical protein